MVNTWQLFRIDIQQVAKAGVFLALLTVTKLLDTAMPKINGIAAWEIYYTIGAFMVLVIPFTISTIVFIAAPLLWLAIGQISMNGPWSMVFDYFLPMLGLLVIKGASRRFLSPLLVIVAGCVKLLAHTVSGKLFWATPWWTSLLFNLPFTAITTVITAFAIWVVFRKAIILRNMGININRSIQEYIGELTGRYVDTYTVIRKGYLNTTIIFELEKRQWLLKIANGKVNTLSTEFTIVSVFFKNSIISKNKRVLLRPYIVGEPISELNALQKNQLIEQIEQFHKIEGIILEKHNWMEYSHFHFFICRTFWVRYCELVEHYQNDAHVPSHNDLNLQNIIASDNAVHLLDFEWARMNNPLFDYASLYVYDNVLLRSEDASNSKFYDMAYMISVFGYLWTFSIPFSFKARRLRKFFRQKIHHLFTKLVV